MLSDDHAGLIRRAAREHINADSPVMAMAPTEVLELLSAHDDAVGLRKAIEGLQEQGCILPCGFDCGSGEDVSPCTNDRPCAACEALRAALRPAGQGGA